MREYLARLQQNMLSFNRTRMASSIRVIARSTAIQSGKVSKSLSNAWRIKCLAVFRVCRICRICPLCVRQQTVPLCVVVLKLWRSWFISLQVTKASLMLSGQRLRQKIAFGAQPQQPLSCWIPHCLRPWLFLTMSFTRQAAATANSIPRQNVLVMISVLFWFEFQGKVDARSTRAWVSLNTLIYFDYIHIDNWW